MKPTDTIAVTVSSLEWWLQLATINPQDLVPRIKSYLDAERERQQKVEDGIIDPPVVLPEGWTRGTIEMINGLELAFIDDRNGAGWWRCPICEENVQAGPWEKGKPTMPNPLGHYADCPINLKD